MNNKTIAKYHKILESLGKDAGVSLEDILSNSFKNNERLVESFLKKKDYSLNTFRLYRSAIKWHLKKEKVVNRVLVSRLDNVAVSGYKKKSNRTNGSSAKNLTSEDKRLLRDYLWKNNSRANLNQKAAEAYLWLHAIDLFGLRPSEWKNAVLVYEGERPILKVKNAKRGRENLKLLYRNLYLDEYSNDDIQFLNRFLGVVSEFSNDDKKFSANQKRLARWLKRGSRKIWEGEKSITLYTGRHSFKNRCYHKLSPAEVAALMGHLSDASPSMYGFRKNKKGSGGGPDVGNTNEIKVPVPLPDPMEVMQVKNIHGKKLETLNNNLMEIKRKFG